MLTTQAGITLGKTGRKVTRCGLGGEGILRTFGKEALAAAVLEAAIEAGIAYFDCARAYAGSEGYHGQFWTSHAWQREQIFLCSKSASRDARGARQDLETTLATMGVDHLDLWQLHDMRTPEDLAAIEGPGGALDAFLEARSKGYIRHIGVTGHHDPKILARAVQDWPVDIVLLPINPQEGVLGGFLTQVLPLARSKRLGIIGMKILGAGTLLDPRLGLQAEDLVRYALSKGADVAIVGCSTPEHVRAHVAATEKGPLPEAEACAMEDRIRPFAAQLAYYRGVL